MILTSKHTDFSTLYRGNHSYNFQGQESDNEVKGEGNSYTTMFRQLDPRIGRWLSLDPEMKKYASKTPYMTFSNNPIIMIDHKGDDDYFHADGTFSQKVNETFDVKGNTQKLEGMIKDFNNGAGKKLGFYINVSGSEELIKIEAKKYRKPKK